MSRVIFLRHGERNFGIGDADLNAEGLRQADAISLNADLLGVKTLLSSPKKRTIQTITPLAKKLGLSISTENQLDQRSHQESPIQFETRIQFFINQLESKKFTDPILICTHSDWLQIAISGLYSNLYNPQSESLFSCAEYKIFIFENKIWNFIK